MVGISTTSAPISRRGLARPPDCLLALVVKMRQPLNGSSCLEPEAVFFARLKKLRIAPDNLAHLQVAAIGPATQREIEEQGLKVAVTPEKYIAESVVQALKDRTRGKRVLLVRAKVARDVLPNELKKAGAKVDVAEAYETHIPRGAKAKLNRLFSNDSSRPDIVTFTSSSTATNFLPLLEKDHWHGLREIWLASIGPVTSETLRQAGFKTNIEALEYTMEGLALAIAKHVLTTHPSE